MPDVPFVSQLSNAPRNDCGPACALMLAQWAGKRTEKDTVEAWAKRVDVADDGTTASELAHMLQALGLTPALNAALEYPHIALVDYAQLPKANRIDQTGKTFAHWIVRLSDTQYHDPYHWKGGQTTTKAILDVAINVGAAKYWRNTVLKLGILEGMMTTKMAVDSPGGLNVRAWAGVAPNNKIGLLADGDVVVVIGEDASGWKKIALVDNAKGSKVNGWVSGVYLKQVTAPAPTPSPQPNPVVQPTPSPFQREGGVRLGVNVLNRHEEVALPLAQRGCRFFMVLNNPGFASRIKNEYPDATVMVRRHWNRQMPSVEAAIAGMEGCHDPRLIYTGINEGDEVGQGTVEQIRQRAEFDIALARRIKEISGATYAAGTFSMGTPDFTQPQICSAIRALYAEAYNTGLIWWDHHLYSPVIDHIYLDNELQWFETRWQFLFTRCGFDPDSASRVICSETGEDEGGVGGFPAHGRNEDQVAAWGRRFVEVQSRPLVVGGVAHPSPFAGGAICQVGNRADWAGYNVEGLLGKMSWE